MINIHATAILVGRAGLLFVGPSGSGKSMLAFNCLAAAQRGGAPAALVADDQVFLAAEEAGITAYRPETIAGLIEIRGSGIAEITSIPAAAMQLAILPVDLAVTERLPPANENYDIAGIGTLPLLRLDRLSREPLAVIAAFHPDIGIPTTRQARTTDF